MTRIVIDVDVLNNAGSGLRTTASGVTEVARLAGAAHLADTSFGSMNSALAPRINRFAIQSSTLIEAAGALIDHLGQVTHDEAVSWARTEREITAEISALSTRHRTGDALLS